MLIIFNIVCRNFTHRTLGWLLCSFVVANGLIALTLTASLASENYSESSEISLLVIDNTMMVMALHVLFINRIIPLINTFDVIIRLIG